MPHTVKRREFIDTSLKAAGALSLLSLPGILYAGMEQKEYTVQDVINILLKDIPGAPFKDTVDTIKSGNATQKVTGIVTTMFATDALIEQTAKLGANFIIAHEPTFYSHTDDANWVPGSGVVKQKQDLLQKYGIAVWRFHDGWHAHNPDGITYGVLKKAAWLDYKKEGDPVLQIPAMRLKDVVMHLKQSLNIDKVRVIGDLDLVCSRIGLMPGAAGGQSQMAFAEKQQPDVLIVGEVHEWETAEYFRDAIQMGAKTSLVVLGHGVSEEPGMEWLVDWLQPKVPGLKITHIASGNPFAFV